MTKDPFWMMSGALAGIIAVASGLDIYFGSTVIIISTVAGMIIQPCANWLEGLGIDDAVGAVTIHGTIGVFGMVILGVLASGYPALGAFAPEDAATISFSGQLMSAGVMFLMGFVPGYVVSLLLKSVGMLRVPDAVQIKGLDVVKVPAQAFPESMSSPDSEA
jgi:ammonia channel protein AmtB